MEPIQAMLDADSCGRSVRSEDVWNTSGGFNITSNACFGVEGATEWVHEAKGVHEEEE